MTLLHIAGIIRSFYGVQALAGVDLTVRAGTVTGLIGPNGAGKTTLFNVVSGLLRPDRGTVTFDAVRADPRVQEAYLGVRASAA